MYLKERLSRIKAGTFVEIGCGQGMLTQVLLEAGWSGTAYDLNEKSLEKSAQLNSKFVADGKLVLKNQDWLDEPSDVKVDLIISALVLEHMDDAAEALYIKKCKSSLKENGRALLFVPNSPDHWGIEDDIAGHYRRYTKKSLCALFGADDWRCDHTAALTYPLSNWLLPVSNILVKRSEASKLKQSMVKRTVQSGNRNVAFKTSFPSILGLLLNETTMMPFYLLQKASIEREDALILYGEFVSAAKVSQSASPDERLVFPRK